MRIYLASWTEENQKTSLDKMGYDTRLLSYFFIREAKDFLFKYVEADNAVNRDKKI